MANTTNCWEV